MTTRKRCRWAAAIAALFFLGGPALADKGDKRGWSLDSDPRKRVFLKFVPSDDGPRILLIGCLRDADTFLVMSAQGVAGPQNVTLTLANGPARYSLEGKIEPNGAGVGQAGFVSELDTDATLLQQLRAKLLPVLEGQGPIVLTVGQASRELPIAGLSKPWSDFKAVCFGQR